MTQSNNFQSGGYTNTMGSACGSIVPTSADLAFQSQQNANQILAQQLTVMIFDSLGHLDGNLSNAATRKVQSIYANLTSAVITANGLTAALFSTQTTDWSATYQQRLAAAQAYR